ncbi:hypothetical protein H764_YJM555E00294, partial [Saccharomyces cerevisiae YJM555]
HVVSSAYFEIQ